MPTIQPVPRRASPLSPATAAGARSGSAKIFGSLPSGENMAFGMNESTSHFPSTFFISTPKAMSPTLRRFVACSSTSNRTSFPLTKLGCHCWCSPAAG